MPKVNIQTLQSLTNNPSATNIINNNFSRVQEAIENTLSRDGTQPNQLQDVLDVNNNKIINVPPPVDETDLVRLGDVQDMITESGSVVFATKEQAEEGVSENTVMSPLRTNQAQLHYTRERGEVNLLDFGVDNTGANVDNAPLIQSAIDSLPTAGGTIIVPVGTIRIKSSITTNKPGLRIRGTGSYNFNSSVNPSGSVFLYDGDNAKLEFNGVSNLVHTGPIIEGVNFVKAQENQVGDALLIRLMNRWAVRDCSFLGFDRGIAVDAAQGDVVGGDAAWGHVQQIIAKNTNIGVASLDQTNPSHSGASFLVEGGDFECLVAGVYLGIHTPQCRIIGTKMDCIGAYGVWSKGYANIIMGNTFEGSSEAVRIEKVTGGTAHSFSGDGHMVIGNNITGRVGTESGVVIVGAGALKNEIIGNRWSNLAARVTDGGSGTVVMDADQFIWNVVNGVITMPSTASFLNQFAIKGNSTGAGSYLELWNTATGGKQWRMRSLSNGKLYFQNASDTIGNIALTSPGGVEFQELAADHPTPSANVAVLFARDNGSGKTQLCARFQSGQVVVIATDP